MGFNSNQIAYLFICLGLHRKDDFMKAFITQLIEVGNALDVLQLEYLQRIIVYENAFAQIISYLCVMGKAYLLVLEHYVFIILPADVAESTVLARCHSSSPLTFVDHRNFTKVVPNAQFTMLYSFGVDFSCHKDVKFSFSDEVHEGFIEIIGLK